MLGKDVTTDYDAQRNYHYKLTLTLKNNANENDWHIVYDLDPDIIGLDPCYISYLYNQTMDYSLTIVGGELQELTAQIPNNEITQKSWSPKGGEVTEADQAAAQAVGGKVYWDGAVYDPGPWNGFLSLRKTTETRYGSIAENYGSTNPNTYKLNKIKFYGSYAENPDPKNNNVNNLGYREYLVTPGVHQDEAGDYTVTKTAPNEYTVKIPLFTRPLVMVAQTGYSGNNPYVAYNRLSQVVFTAKVLTPEGEIKTIDKTINVIQARRVVNPKAVWRKADSTRPFHVQLKIRESQTSDSFTDLLSEGPWRAEVTCGDWITLMPTSGASKLNPDGSISDTGITYDPTTEVGRAIDFSFKPSSATSTPRGGIITIYYNNYSCVHTIFVRQGYEPVQFYGAGPMWHTGNLFTGGDENTDAVEVDDPQVEGSYFRRYNRLYPIDASSNTAPDPFEVVDRLNSNFTIAGTNETKRWSDITLSPMPTTWGNFTVNGNSCRLPSEAEWKSIIGNSNTIYGYGILYGDEAVETKTSITEAYGADSTNKAFGMRGMIVCDESTGTQIFLPIAASGYGRFKQKCPVDANNRLPKGYGGVVQYANRHAPFPSTGDWNVSYKPLFYDLYANLGTLYWFNGNDALDINYTTIDFALQTQADVGVVWGNNADPSGTDAIHIRLVHDP